MISRCWGLSNKFWGALPPGHPSLLTACPQLLPAGFSSGQRGPKHDFQHFHQPSRENFSPALFKNSEKPSKKRQQDFSGSIANQERRRSCSYLALGGVRAAEGTAAAPRRGTASGRSLPAPLPAEVQPCPSAAPFPGSDH